MMARSIPVFRIFPACAKFMRTNVAFSMPIFQRVGNLLFFWLGAVKINTRGSTEPCQKKDRRIIRRPRPFEGDYFVLTAVRRHFVHSTFVCFRFPCQTATLWRLGRNVRRVARLENDRLWPKERDFPQESHFAIANFLPDFFRGCKQPRIVPQDGRPGKADHLIARYK
jgi:hypothetical protein